MSESNDKYEFIAMNDIHDPEKESEGWYGGEGSNLDELISVD